MAVNLLQNGIGDSTTEISVLVRSTSNGVCTLTVGGRSVSATASTATDDGCVALTMTGLVEGTAYTYTVTTPDGTETGTQKTLNADGPVRFGVISCQSPFDLTVAPKLLTEDIHHLVHLGDEAYKEGSFLEDRTTMQDLDRHYEMRRFVRGVPSAVLNGKKRILGRDLMTKMGYVTVMDDHDYLSNDCVDDLVSVRTDLITFSNWSGGEAAAFTQGEFDIAKKLGATAQAAYTRHHPTCSSASADTGAFYFDYKHGNTHVIVLSQKLSFWDFSDDSHYMADVPDNTTPLLSAGQLASIKDILETTDRKFKVICSPKVTRFNRAANTDRFTNYTDLEGGSGLLDWIQANSASWVTPGGVLWVCGDWHSPGAFAVENGVDSEVYDHVNVIAAPCGRYEVADLGDSDPSVQGPSDAYRWGLTAANNRVNKYWYNCYCIVETTDTTITASLKSITTGTTFVSVTVTEGENKLTIPPPVEMS